MLRLEASKPWSWLVSTVKKTYLKRLYWLSSSLSVISFTLTISLFQSPRYRKYSKDGWIKTIKSQSLAFLFLCALLSGVTKSRPTFSYLQRCGTSTVYGNRGKELNINRFRYSYSDTCPAKITIHGLSGFTGDKTSDIDCINMNTHCL